MARHGLSGYFALDQFVHRGGILQMGDVPITEIAQQYGTPCYVYDVNIIKRNFDRIRNVFADWNIAYSLKANPSLGLCGLLARLGSMAEIASGGELQCALRAGFNAKDILYAGPAKQDWELELACRQSIGVINAESEAELVRLGRMSKAIGPAPPVCLRINTRRRTTSANEQMVGGASRFGIDQEAIPMVLAQVPQGITVRGIHVYSGSQILKEQEVIRNVSGTLKLFQRMRKQYGHMDTVVCGLGLGVPCGKGERELNLVRIGRSVKATMKKLGLEKWPRLICEVGRYVLANAGVFVSRVIDIKLSRGRVFVSTDGGMNAFTRPSFMKTEHPVFAIDQLGQSETVSACVGGPLCTPLDAFVENVRLPAIAPGNLIGVFVAGAYGHTMSMSKFLSHSEPAEVAVDGGRVYLLRQRVSAEEHLKQQQFPQWDSGIQGAGRPLCHSKRR